MLRAKLFAAAVAAALIPAAALSAAEYDLSSYLEKVERDNTDIALARRSLEEAGQTVARARSQLLPMVAAQGTYTRNMKDITQPMPAGVVLDGTTGFKQLEYVDYDVNSDNEVMMALSVSQKIIDPLSIAQFEQARKGRSISSQALELTRRGVRNGAKKLYAQTQLILSMVAVMETSERTAEETYRDIERKYRVGLAKELDMLMAEVDWKSRIPKTAEARKNAELALMALKNLAGIPLGEQVVLTEKVDVLPDLPSQPGLDGILASRPDYSIEVLSRDIADIARKASVANFLPTLSANFAYAWQGSGNGSAYDDSDVTVMTFGATLTVPLFTGGYRLSLMESAKIQQQQQARKIAQKKLDIEQELLGLQLQLSTAKSNLESAGLVVETAQRAHRLAKAAFDNGLATQLSVSQASTNLDQARLGLLNAQYEYRAAYYDWEQATGSRD
jgi:outer membrane protein TolC